MYSLDIKPHADKIVQKISKKNRKLLFILNKKIRKVVLKTQQYFHNKI